MKNKYIKDNYFKYPFIEHIDLNTEESAVFLLILFMSFKKDIAVSLDVITLRVYIEMIIKDTICSAALYHLCFSVK